MTRSVISHSHITSVPNLGRRNMIINGDMRIAQRGTAAVIPNDGEFVSVDRFAGRHYGGSGRFSMERVSHGDGGVNTPNGEFGYALKCTVTTTATSEDAYNYGIKQNIEADTFTRMGWGRNEAGETLKSCTLSYWMKTSVAGIYSVSLRSNGASRSIVKETPSIAANTWTKVVLTFVGDSNTGWRASGTGNGCLVEWSFANSTAKGTSTLDVHQSGNYVSSNNQVRWIANSGATFYITGVQLEEGTTDTPFEHRHYGEEFRLCQRYYQEYQACAQEWIYFESNYLSHKWWQSYIYTPMRGTPATTNDGGFNGGAAGGTINSITRQSISKDRISWRVTFSGNLGQRDPYHTDTFEGNIIKMDAEL